LRPVSGTITATPVADTRCHQGRIGGGEATANIEARQDSNGVALNARLELSGVDGAALHYVA